MRCWGRLRLEVGAVLFGHLWSSVVGWMLVMEPKVFRRCSYGGVGLVGRFATKDNSPVIYDSHSTLWILKLRLSIDDSQNTK